MNTVGCSCTGNLVLSSSRTSQSRALQSQARRIRTVPELRAQFTSGNGQAHRPRGSCSSIQSDFPGSEEDFGSIFENASNSRDPELSPGGCSSDAPLLQTPSSTENGIDTSLHVINSATQIPCSRRDLLLCLSAFSLTQVTAATSGPALAVSVTPARIDPLTQPGAAFDATDETLRRVAEVFQGGLNADTVEKEESQWTEVITIAESAPDGTPWANDILSRAYGNRGNARSRQGRLDEAIEDYNKSIQLAPYAADPVLNRGVALEAQRRFEEAAADYRAVLEYDPRDPSAWNNLGNIMAATGKWDEAAANYRRATEIAPEFSFAAANLALAQYQLGNDNQAIKQMRQLLRRYPEFPDMRAALAVSLYSAGLFGDAETNWIRLEDLRYKDVSWVKDVRRWPPRLVADLEKFLRIAPS